jgi:hypothetical protein
VKAVVHLLPTPQELSEAAGRQMTQALSALGAGAFPGARIPVDVSSEGGPRTIEFRDAVRSESDPAVVRFFDEGGREKGLVPLHRVDYVEFVK